MSNRNLELEPKWLTHGAYQSSHREEQALHKASRHVPHRSWCQGCIAARTADKPYLGEQHQETDEAVPRIEFYFADLGREDDHVLPFLPSDVGSESLLTTLCPTKALSECLVETILAFVETLGHNVVMLHSDQEPVLVQLLRLCSADESSGHW